MNQKIIEHFKKSDPILFDVIGKIEPIDGLFYDQNFNYFANLCRSIVNQQLSNKVGKVIFARFQNLFPNGEINAQQTLEIPDESLKAIGLSKTKVSYIKDLAQKVANKELELDNLKNLENEQIIKELIKVKGIGVWTGEMFLMFSLGREDIFSHGDLALKNAVIKLYQLSNPTRAEIEQITLKWSPYRSYACRILWKSLSLKD